MGSNKLELVIGTKSWSSWSLRAWLGLKVAGVPFTEIPIKLRSEGTSPEILQHSPAGQVPILKTPEGIIWESLAILEYIADRFPEAGLWPEDPMAQAHARSVACEMHSGFQPLRNDLPMDFTERHPKPDLTEDVLSDIDRIQAIWLDCREKYGASGKFLYGGFTVADAMYAPVISRFITYGIEVSETSSDYMSAVFSLPAIKEWAAGARAEEPA